MSYRFPTIILFALSLLLTPLGSSIRRDLPPPKPQPGSDRIKLSGDMLALLDTRDSAISPQDPDRQSIEVDLHVDALDDALLATIASRGVEVIASHPRYGRVIGSISLDDLAGLISLPEIRRVAPNVRPLVFGDGLPDACFGIYNGGEPDRPAAALIGADRLDLRGENVSIGIISDTFRSRIEGEIPDSNPSTNCGRVFRESTPQMRNFLPDRIYLLDNGPLEGSDEGRALAELIYSLAPAADIYFHSGARSLPDLAAAIDELVGCGVDIIVDDLLYPSEAMFRDGIVARAVDRAANAGVLYFSAAGNLGGFGVEGITARDVARPAGSAIPQSLHTFGNGSTYAKIRLPAGCGVQFVLQWDEDAGAAETDLDLYVCTDRSPEQCIFASRAVQGCGAGAEFGDPIEIVRPLVNNSLEPKTAYLAVDQFCGSAGVKFRVVPWHVSCPSEGPPGERRIEIFEKTGLTRDTTAEPDEVFNGPQIYGHAAANGALAVGAAYFQELTDLGIWTNPRTEVNVEPFSSRGREIKRDDDGIPDDPECRTQPERRPFCREKPDMIAPDGVSTSFFSCDIGDGDNDGFPDFEGTSAAAAIASGGAALLMSCPQEFDGFMCPPAGEVLDPEEKRKRAEAIRKALLDTACSLEDWGDDGVTGCPERNDGQHSVEWGRGVVNVWRAYQRLRQPQAPVRKWRAPRP